VALPGGVEAAPIGDDALAADPRDAHETGTE
jgi:hypothetical protein